MNPILDIENQLTSIIQNGFTAVSGPTLHTVDSFAGTIDLDKQLRTVPGIFINFSGFGEPVSQTQFKTKWTLYVITHNAGGEEARREGDIRNIGAYDAIHILMRTLHQNKLDDYGRMKIVSGQNMFSEAFARQNVAVYALETTLNVDWDLNPDEAGLNDFTTFAADWDLATPDSQIDAQDKITLETAS